MWRKYEEFVDAGVLIETLEWVYKKGRESGYKAPSALAEEREKEKENGGGESGETVTPARKSRGLFERTGGFGGSPLR